METNIYDLRSTSTFIVRAPLSNFPVGIGFVTTSPSDSAERVKTKLKLLLLPFFSSSPSSTMLLLKRFLVLLVLAGSVCSQEQMDREQSEKVRREIEGLNLCWNVSVTRMKRRRNDEVRFL